MTLFAENFVYRPVHKLKPIVWWAVAFALGVAGWFVAVGLQELYKDWQFLRTVRINTERQLQQQVQQPQPPSRPPAVP